MRETEQLASIGSTRICKCPPNHLNCMTAKEWTQSQIGVWRFSYGERDIRDKEVHPATFPIALATRVIKLFTHEGELVLDPFVGSGTTLVAARDMNRNAVGFDLQEKYVSLSNSRLKDEGLFTTTRQLAIQADARDIPHYIHPESVSLIFTSPPYANLLNCKRKNKSMRFRNNKQLGKIEQYSQDPRDLGTLGPDRYTVAIGEIFESLLPLLKPGGHCVINVLDMWWENRRYTLHVSIIKELRMRGFDLRNIIIWYKTNVVNQIGIFGWPSNYFEYLLHFCRSAAQ